MAVPVLWRTQKQRYSLQAELCPHCTSAVFPPRMVCPYCLRTMSPAAQNASAQGREFVYSVPGTLFAAANAAVAGDD